MTNGQKQRLREWAEWGTRTVMMTLLAIMAYLGSSLLEEASTATKAIIRLEEQGKARAAAIENNEQDIRELRAAFEVFVNQTVSSNERLRQAIVELTRVVERNH